MLRFFCFFHGSRCLFLLLLLTAFAVAWAASPKRVSLVLARDGRALATIVIARQATKAAQFAAYELQWHLQQITNAVFPIRYDDQPAAGLKIYVGESRGTRALGFTNARFGPQEYLIRFLPNALILMGRDKPDTAPVRYNQMPTQEELDTWPSIWDEQGTMYAVYDFLERYCGVRWLNPTESGTDCPHCPTLIVSGSELRRAPFFRYRYAAYPLAEHYDTYTGLWPSGSEGQKAWEAAAYPELQRRFTGQAYTLAKRGWNMLFRFRHREGGEICLGNHSFYGYYARFWAAEPGREALFEGAHPEFFAQGYTGRPPQLCYTSPALIQQVVKDAREFFDTGKTYPGAQAAGDFFCVEPMDNDQFCRCPRCQEWLRDIPDADSPFFSNGRHSDYFFQFVNAVAREVRKTHPHKRIVALAYMTHAEPPKRVRLEPNVVIQYCFACHRLPYDRPSYEHEWAQLQRWRAQYPQLPLYLWLYYTFPVEIANNGHFHCFPGFFAHTIGEQFDLFRRLKIRGIFHCGYGQEVEAYVTYRLMDDPTQRIDELLEEYFTRLYGPAGKPLRQFYELVERTYCDPANYPPAIAEKRHEGHHHQTIEMAWGYLGTEQRMAALERLMKEAMAAAQTPEQKHRVELFGLGVWEYMRQGRQQYLERMRQQYGGQAPPVRIPYYAGRQPLTDTDLAATEAITITTWRSRRAEPTRRRLTARLLQDGQVLWIQLEEGIKPGRLSRAADIVSGDHWEIQLASGREGPLYHLRLSPGADWQWDGESPLAPPIIKSGPDRWIARVRLPLALTKGQRLFLNILRRSPHTSDEPMWAPIFDDETGLSALRELICEGPETIPAPLSDEEFEQLAKAGLVAAWPCHEGRGQIVSSQPPGLPGRLMNGARWDVDDQRRPCVRLQDSRRQYIDFGSPPAVNLTGPFSLLMWIKYEPTDTMYPALLGKGYEATGTYSLHLRPGQSVWLEIDAPDGTRHIYNPTERVVPAEQWAHVAGTYDGAVLRVYINGREAGSGKHVQAPIRANAEPLRFGWLGSYGHFNGCVRDIRLYARALTPAEIYGHFCRGR